MTELRSHPISPALNRPLTILGIETRYFYTGIGMCFVLGFWVGFTSGWGLWGGMMWTLMFFAGYLVLMYSLSASDPLKPAVLFESARIRLVNPSRIYDALEFEPCGVKWQNRSK